MSSLLGGGDTAAAAEATAEAEPEDSSGVLGLLLAPTVGNDADVRELLRPSPESGLGDAEGLEGKFAARINFPWVV